MAENETLHEQPNKRPQAKRDAEPLGNRRALDASARANARTAVRTNSDKKEIDNPTVRAALEARVEAAYRKLHPELRRLVNLNGAKALASAALSHDPQPTLEAVNGGVADTVISGALTATESDKINLTKEWARIVAASARTKDGAPWWAKAYGVEGSALREHPQEGSGSVVSGSTPRDSGSGSSSGVETTADTAFYDAPDYSYAPSSYSSSSYRDADGNSRWISAQPEQEYRDRFDYGTPGSTLPQAEGITPQVVDPMGNVQMGAAPSREIPGAADAAAATAASGFKRVEDPKQRFTPVDFNRLRAKANGQLDMNAPIAAFKNPNDKGVAASGPMPPPATPPAATPQAAAPPQSAMDRLKALASGASQTPANTSPIAAKTAQNMSARAKGYDALKMLEQSQAEDRAKLEENAPVASSTEPSATSRDYSALQARGRGSATYREALEKKQEAAKTNTPVAEAAQTPAAQAAAAKTETKPDAAPAVAAASTAATGNEMLKARARAKTAPIPSA
jgi:hypothetical protein